LRHRRGFSLELVPARVLSAACLTADRRKRRFFGPRRSYRILQHESDARARPLRATAPLPPGARRPAAFTVAACADAMWRAVLICVTVSMNPHGPILPARCFTGPCPGHGWPKDTPDDHGAATLSPAKTSSRYSRSPRKHPLSFDCGNTGRRSRAKDWHVPLPGFGGVRCEFPSSRAPEHPSVADLVRVVLEWIHTWPPTGQGFRSNDTPRRMALFREPGCLEPFLGHDGRGDCSPEDRSSLGLRHTASDRPLGDAALFGRTLPTERPMLFG
jgi:hypothetical protein